MRCHFRGRGVSLHRRLRMSCRPLKGIARLWRVSSATAICCADPGLASSTPVGAPRRCGGPVRQTDESPRGECMAVGVWRGHGTQRSLGVPQRQKGLFGLQARLAQVQVAGTGQESRAGERGGGQESESVR